MPSEVFLVFSYEPDQAGTGLGDCFRSKSSMAFCALQKAIQFARELELEGLQCLRHCFVRAAESREKTTVTLSHCRNAEAGQSERLLRAVPRKRKDDFE